MKLAQPGKFLLVGAGGYVVNLAIFAVLQRAGINYLPASLISYFVANAVMYLGNRYFTFDLGHDGFWAMYLRYALVGGIVAGLNAFLLAFLVKVIGLAPTAANAVSLLLITPVAYILNKRWTFHLSAA